MIRIDRKSSVPGLLLFWAVLGQVSLILINLQDATDNVNYLMYINNYVIGFLIILTLVSKGGSKHFLAIAFITCFLVFLMGQKPFEPEYNVYLTFVRLELDTKQYFIFSCILFMGLAVTYYSYAWFNQKDKSRDSTSLRSTSVNYQAIKPILTVILLVTLPCALYMQAKIVVVRGGMAYTSGYLVNVDVPAVIKAGYYIYSIVILLYLALKPTKMQLLFFLGTYIIIEGGLQLFQGRRALFASTFLFTIWYLFKYLNLKKIDGKYYALGGVAFAGLFILLYVVEQARDSNSTALSFNLVRRVLVSTGGSDSVIANTIYRKDQFPASGIAYLLNPLVNNFLGNTLLGKTSAAQGLVYLQQHNSFSHWISYMTEPSLYLSGHGMGSSYLAEVYLAFGVAGIPVVSCLIGWCINKLNNIQFNDNIFKTGLIFFIVRRLFTLPRDGLFSWIGSLIYLVFTYFVIYPFYYRFCRTLRRA